MIEFIKEHFTLKQYILLGILAVSGISLFIIGIINLPYVISGDADNLNQMLETGEEPKKLDIVEVDVKFVLCCYAESETGYRSIRTEKKHYIVILEDNKCMSLAVKDEATIAKLEKLMSATNKYLNGYDVDFPECVHFNAIIKDLNSNAESYYKEGLNYYGLTVNDAHFLELDVSKTRGMLAASLVCSVILMIGAVMYIKSSINDKKLKASSFNALENDNSSDPLKVFANRRIDDTFEDEYTMKNTVSNNSNQENMSYSNSNTTSGTSRFTLKKD